MKSISVRRLRARAGEVLRDVQEHGARFVVTWHGRPVAVLGPVDEASRADLDRENITAFLASVDQLAADVAAAWDGASAVDAVSEQRR